MDCTFIFNDQVKLSLKTDSVSPLLGNEVINAIRFASKEQKEELYTLIESTIGQINNLGVAKITKLREKKLVPTDTIQTLQQEFPDIEFPVGVQANILLLNNLTSNGQVMRGRIIDSDGNKFFIIKGKSKKDAKRLANYLQIKKISEENSFRFDETSSNYKDLQQILSLRNKQIKVGKKLESVLDMIVDFQESGSSYRNILYIPEGSNVETNAYYLLSEIRNQILERAGRTTFDNQIINDIYQLSIYLGKGNILLRHKDIFNTIKNDEKLKQVLDILRIKKYQDLKDFNKLNIEQIISEKTTLEQELIHNIFSNLEISNYTNLMNYIFSFEPTFQYEYKSNTADGLIYYFQPKTIKDKYGIEYDTIYKMDIENENFKGYKIFKQFSEDGNTYYIPSRGYLTEDFFTKRFNTLEEAQKYINFQIENQNINKFSLLPFKFRKYNNGEPDLELDSNVLNTSQFLIQGSIIESLDIPINPLQEIFNQSEKDLLNFSKTLSDFYKIVEGYFINQDLKNQIKEEINTPEKAAIFVYKINERLLGNRSNNEAFIEVLDLIDNAKTRNYFIESKNYDYKTKGWNYHVIPITDVDTIEEYRKNKNYPIEKYMQALKLHMDKLNVNLELRTSEEIKEDFPDIDANTSKAFIYDGTIYINTSIAETSDMLHEYTHLLLGILRSDPKLRTNYEQMLYALVNTRQGKKLFEKLKSVYPERSKVDIMEETFAKLFSEHLIKGSNFNDIFNSEPIKEGVSKLFNQEITNIKSFFGQGITSLFNTFGQEIKNLLDNTEQLDFDMTKTSRRYSTWISNKLASRELQEDCI